MSHKGSSFGDFLTGAIVGGTIGYLVAILFAPRPGEETRQMLAERGMELRDRAVEQVEKTGKIVAEGRGRVEEKAGEAVELSRERVTEAKEQAESVIQEVRAQASETLRRTADQIDPKPGQQTEV